MAGQPVSDGLQKNANLDLHYPVDNACPPNTGPFRPSQPDPMTHKFPNVDMYMYDKASLLRIIQQPSIEVGMQPLSSNRRSPMRTQAIS